MMFNSQNFSIFQPHYFNFFSHARLLTTALILLLVSGCGGGSGGGSSSSANFTLSSQSLSFVADFNGSLPADQTIQLSWSDSDIAGFAYVFTSSNPQPDWIDLDASSSTSPADLTFSVNTTSMTPGTYHATLPLYSGDISANPLSHKDISVSYTIRDKLTVSPTTLDYAYAIGSTSNPASQTLSLGGQSINWSASSNASWLITGNNSGSTPANLSVSVDPAGLAAGDYSGLLTLSNTANSDSIVVPVTFSVTEPALVTNLSSLTFAGINGGNIAAQSLTIAINNHTSENWTAMSDQGWLILSKTSGTTADLISVSVDPSVGPLTSGGYSATISLSSSSAGQELSASIPVTLNLTQATLTLNPDAVLLGGTDGLDESAQTVSIALDTNANAYAWSAQLTSGWLIADKTSGSASATADQISFDVDRSSVVGGTYQDDVEVSLVINGDTIQQTLPVTFNLEAHKLFIADNGVAMVSTPGITSLTRTLTVKDTLGKSIEWSASSDQSWLTVTSSGLSGDDLVLTANTSGLTADKVYLAKVTVSSADTGVENTETVRVGLWIGSSDPNVSDTINTGYTQIKADPVRPYVYAHNDGTDIDVYNVYTAGLVATISNVATQLGQMTISKDGSTLFAMDTSTQNLIPVNLDTYAISTGWVISGNNADPYLSYTRVKANDFIFTANGHAYDISDGSEQPATYVTNNVLATNRGGNTLCGVNRGSSPYTLNCYRLDYSALNGGLLQIGSNVSLSPSGGNGRDVAISADGNRVYVAAGWPYHFVGYNFDGTSLTADQTLDADSGYPNSVEFSDDDQLYASASYAINLDIWVYDISSGNSLFSSTITNTIVDRQLVISGDGMRAMMLTNVPGLVLITAP